MSPSPSPHLQHQIHVPKEHRKEKTYEQSTLTQKLVWHYHIHYRCAESILCESSMFLLEHLSMSCKVFAGC
jgi:hypothetical protein